MIVMKFGGTSVESTLAIARVAAIVKDRLAQRPVVVVSAMGKTTNKLLEIAAKAVAGDRTEAFRLLAALEAFHYAESPADASEIIAAHFQELSAVVEELVELKEFPPQYVDLVSSYGERLSSHIVALTFQKLGIDAIQVDARSVIITDRRHAQASPLYPRTYAKLAALVKPLVQSKVVVMGGFIGSTQDGFTTTLGRGGSDFTGAIVGAGLDAEEIQIWTDVDGMLTCDPRIVPGGHRVKVISFGEAAELAYFGAKVLHPATVVPAVEKNIPVRILNSKNPASEGTRIVADHVPCANPVKSIACKQGITLVNIVSLRMLMAHGFLHRIFDIFDRYRTPVDVVTTSEVSVSLTIDNKESLADICEELRQIAEVTVEENQALICLVGDAIRERPGVALSIFKAMGDVNVKMISQSASSLNLTMLVAGDDLKKAVTSLHNHLFATLDAAVFD